ncbi:hypothetical protein [Streptomyces sp. DSM 40907]|nr:hypothetical protein [Streptomyces sp. DSM 40907]
MPRAVRPIRGAEPGPRPVREGQEESPVARLTFPFVDRTLDFT